jgi:hypothetical protein
MLRGILAEEKRAAAADVQRGVQTKAVPDATQPATHARERAPRERADSKRQKEAGVSKSGNTLPGVRGGTGAAPDRTQAQDVQRKLPEEAVAAK